MSLLSGCPFCGGTLHLANYPRTPHGAPAEFREQYESRFSSCCADCRKRTTPPSVRFFGRYWHISPMLVLISALIIGINQHRLDQIKNHFGVSVTASTWKRWRRWWRDIFQTTFFWRKNNGLMPPVTRVRPVPRALLSLFQGGLEKKMADLLKFLSPLTAGKLRAL